MTLAVGIPYPVEGMAELAEPGWVPSRSIILATDSRWTWQFPDGHVEAEDRASKMFRVHERTVAVYAGESKLGEQCLDELRWSFRTGRLPSSKLGRDNAQDVFSRVYKTSCASRGQQSIRPALYFVLGTCTPTEQTELCYFSYADGFVPQEVTTYKAIGWTEAVRHFDCLFKRNLRFALNQERQLQEKWPSVVTSFYSLNNQIRPEHIAMFAATAIREIIDNGLDDTVGGHIQCAIIKPTSIDLPTFRYTTDPTNKGPGWTRATTHPGELKTLTGALGIYDPRELV